MSKLDDLLEEMTSDEQFLNKKSMQSKTYRDEPIIRRASLMKNYLPPKAEEMRKLGSGFEHYNWSSPKLFYTQGKFMEDYEDDFQYDGTFFRYYPTYQLMSDVQLRGYFAWRTKIRSGEIVYAPLSFVFVYLYELLNQIGVSSPEDGFHKLKDFCEKYSEIDGSVNNYYRDWIVDYTVYYGLDIDLVRGSEDMEPFRQYAVLSEYASHTPEEVFGAVCALSSYNIKNSKFYKTYPEDTERVVCDTILSLSRHYEERCKNTLCERCFGKTHTVPYSMFSSAVFWDRQETLEYFCEIYPGYEYICRGGKWYRTRLDRSPAKNRKLGAIVRDVDAIMREKYDFGNPLQKTDKTKLFTSTVENAIENLREEKKRKAAAVINIDLDKLSGIRLDASETREKLMTEEERGEEESFFSAEKTAALPEEPEASPTAEPLSPALPEEEKPEEEGSLSALLDETEFLVLRCVLSGTDCAEQLRKNGKLLSVVIDSLNEKLFDIFGDNVIYYDGDTPAVYEDYEDELKGMI